MCKTPFLFGLNTYFPCGKVKKSATTPITPTEAAAKSNTSSASTRTAKTDGVKSGTGDATRDRCVELIYDALVGDTIARTSDSSFAFVDYSFFFG